MAKPTPVTSTPPRRRRAGSVAAAQAFRDRVAEVGGKVIGEYVNSGIPVDCICAEGHRCSPRPDNVLRGQGMCRTCVGQDSIVAEAAFQARVAELGGTVVEPHWLGSLKPHRVVCPRGHQCRPRPNGLQQGRGMCQTCAGIDSTQAEVAFRARVAGLGGQVVGQYVNSRTSVECVCIVGHACRPTPNNMRQGSGICRTCAGQDSAVAEVAFRARVAELGGQVIGEWRGSHTSVECLCPQGHRATPTPNDMQQGAGMCRMCVNMVWDVFYVTVNPALGRVKFGITSGDERARLSRHRRAGYTDITRVLPDLPSAPLLERHVLLTLREAGMVAVQGREHFDASALALVLDVVDGWAAS